MVEPFCTAPRLDRARRDDARLDRARCQARRQGSILDATNRSQPQTRSMPSTPARRTPILARHRLDRPLDVASTGLDRFYDRCQGRSLAASRPLAPLLIAPLASFHYEMGCPPSLYYHGTRYNFCNRQETLVQRSEILSLQDGV